MRAPEGTVISYATQPGSVAADGAGADSPYTLALVDTMKQPGLDVLNMFNRVGLAVKRSTAGDQQPWVAASPIDGNYYFAGPGTQPAPPPGPVAADGAPEQYNLGVKYYRGNGVPQNFVEAVRLYRLAADQGYAPAQNDLGIMYEFGQGVDKNYAEAFRLFRLAADQGYALALSNLGFVYESGNGVPANNAEALRLYHLAADKGNAFAKSRLTQLQDSK